MTQYLSTISNDLNYDFDRIQYISLESAELYQKSSSPNAEQNHEILLGIILAI